MTRSLVVFSFLSLASCLFATEELPKSEEDDSFDVEPPLLIPNRDLEKPGEINTQTAPAPHVDLARLEKDFARAQRAAINAARLYKIGAMAEVDVERQRLRVARVQAQLEAARLDLAKENFATAQTRLTNHEISREEFAEAEAAVARAIQAAHGAETKHQRAELEFAENDLARQQKLLGLGSGRRADVARAEQKLNDLKAAQESN